MKKSILICAAVLGLAAATATPAFAKCGDKCKEIKVLWKSKQTVKVGADTYYVARAPKEPAAYVKWKSSVKTITFEAVDAAVMQATSCHAVDTQGIKRLQDAKGGSISTSIFRKVKYVKFGLKC